MKFMRFVTHDLFSLFSVIKGTLIILMFALVGFATLMNVSSISASMNKVAYTSDVLFMSFYGPKMGDYAVIDLFKWFLPQAVFAGLVGDLLDKELKARYIYTIPRMGSLHVWLWSKIVSLLFFSSIYFLIGFLTVFLLSLSVTSVSSRPGDLFVMIVGNDRLSDMHVFDVFLPYFLLLCLAGFLIALLQLLVTLVTNHAIAGTIFTMFFHLISVNIQQISVPAVKWLPSNQGILARHDLLDPLSDLTLGWSYLYLLMAILIVIGLCLTLAGKKELASYTSHL